MVQTLDYRQRIHRDLEGLFELVEDFVYRMRLCHQCQSCNLNARSQRTTTDVDTSGDDSSFFPS